MFWASEESISHTPINWIYRWQSLNLRVMCLYDASTTLVQILLHSNIRFDWGYMLIMGFSRDLQGCHFENWKASVYSYILALSMAKLSTWEYGCMYNSSSTLVQVLWHSNIWLTIIHGSDGHFPEAYKVVILSFEKVVSIVIYRLYWWQTLKTHNASSSFFDTLTFDCISYMVVMVFSGALYTPTIYRWRISASWLLFSCK
jgi:hypothetical protein